MIQYRKLISEINDKSACARNGVHSLVIKEAPVPSVSLPYLNSFILSELLIIPRKLTKSTIMREQGETSIEELGCLYSPHLVKPVFKDLRVGFPNI